MPFITVNNVKLYYEEQGSGSETLVFGHSMLFNLRMFDDQVAVLKAKYRCISFDFRGQGQSEVTDCGYDLESLTEDTAKLLKALNTQPCHFVGFSMGGMVAMRLAVQFPDLIKSLVLIDTSSERQDNMLRNRILIVIAQYFGLKVLAAKVMSMFFGSQFLKDPQRKALRHSWKAYFLANDPKGIVHVVKGVIFREPITETLKYIKQPTLIMVGEEDELTDLKKAQIIHDNIAHSTLHIIPNAAHMGPVEEPEFVTKTIAKFLKTKTNTYDS